MNSRSRRAIGAWAFGAFVASSVAVTGAMSDWPQWRGPDRTGISSETGLLTEWPDGGPPLVWRTEGLGSGYGSMAVVGDRLYLQVARGRTSSVVALDRSDGREVWSRALGPTALRMQTPQGAGPRGTPTVDGDRLYVLTESGDLAALTTDGDLMWTRNILADFGGRQLPWLVSESPLVDGDHVVVTPGGRGAAMVKLDKTTGELVWASSDLSDLAAYSSIVAADVDGVRTYLTFTNSAAVGVRASDGALMFRYLRAANPIANVATPVYADNRVFFSSGYDTGGGLLHLAAEDGRVVASEAYFTRELRNHWGSMVLVDGYLYGYNDLILTCLDFATGERMWRARSVGKGTLIYADGHLYIQGENNELALAEATPEEYRERGRIRIPDQGWPSYAQPVISDGHLYVRNQGVVLAYDIQGR